jgi:acetate kinase
MIQQGQLKTMDDHVITLNAGSSSIKFALYASGGEWPRMLATGQIEALGLIPEFEVRRASDKSKTKRTLDGADAPKNHADGVKIILGWLESAFPGLRVRAIGHRVVHGGNKYSQPTVVDEAVLRDLESFTPLAPLHEPPNVAGIVAANKAFPGVPQIACFDTAFHRTQPFVADTYGLAPQFYDEGVRRYGFHGLSYEYITRRLADIAGPNTDITNRVIICHLGSGASLAGVKRGKGISCTLGFSPLEGLPMGTRCGQIDPGVLLYLMQQKQMSASEISDLLYKKSGLKGMSGVSNDMRDLEASADPRARQAIDYFIYRIQREIGSLMAALGGLDTLVFTAGIGSNSPNVRAEVCEGLGWAGVVLDGQANKNRGTELISAANSRVRVYALQTDEEAMIAQHTLRTAGLGKSVAAE